MFHVTDTFYDGTQDYEDPKLTQDRFRRWFRGEEVSSEDRTQMIKFIKEVRMMNRYRNILLEPLLEEPKN